VDLVQRILAGDGRAVARLMSWVENGDPRAVASVKALYPHTGRAHVVGITGPPGSGKSTLVDQITQELRRREKTVGIVAVDPSSPFSGGAILADRIRMQGRSLDPGVFIRSMATRGRLGGLARATNDVVDILDASGRQYVLLETVGVGQDEVEIVKAAHTSIVIGVPGLGDDIQTIKAGIMEIGDLFVVNKADRDGADRTATEIEMMLQLGKTRPGWQPQVLKTVATAGEGVAEVTEAVLKHQAYLAQSQSREQRGAERSRWILQELLEERLTARILEVVAGNGAMEQLVKRIAARELDPHSAVEDLLRRAGL
jgi:LAO/AO transport system kinase